MVAEYAKITDLTSPIWTTPENAREAAEQLKERNDFVYNCAVTLAGGEKARKDKKLGGWSPHMVVKLHHLKFLIEVRRRITGEHRRPKWTPETFSDGLLRHLKLWTDTIYRHFPKESDANTREKLANITSHGPEFWKKVTLAQINRDMLSTEYGLVKKALQGAKRRAEREQINEAVRMRERMVQEGRISEALNRIQDKPSRSYKMETLRASNGDIITDAYDINNDLIKFFCGWFDCPNYYSDIGDEINTDYLSGFRNKNEFMSKFSSLGMAKQALEYIWAGFNKPFTASGSGNITEPAIDSKWSKLTAAITPITSHENTPSFEEFKKTLKSRPDRSSGGPSCVTYGMLKSCSDSILRGIYDNLAVMWKEKYVPDWWKYRFLSPIPKTDEDNPEPKNLRPLMLMEVLRKVWTQLIVSKIRAVWTTQEAFNKAQGGFTPKSGTDALILQLINAMEEASECGTQLNLASFDKTRAFDSVTKGHIMLAWIRMSAPVDFARYLINLDGAGGKTMIRTPLAQERWRTTGPSGFNLFTSDNIIDRDQVNCFNPARGVGQGDVHSPYSWNALYDILLCSLEAAIEDPKHDKLRFLIRSQNSCLRTTYDKAYADDLIALAARMGFLQLKADIVSAFAMIFGLKIAEKKLRLLSLNYGSEETIKTGVTLRIHSWAEGPLNAISSPTPNSNDNSCIEPEDTWNMMYGKIIAEDVPMAYEGSLKALGIIHDANSENETSLEEASLKLGLITTVMKYKRASGSLRHMALDSCVLPRITYVGRNSAWRYKSYKILNRPYLAALQLAAKNMASSPYKGLIMSKRDGGMGFRAPADVCQIEKAMTLHRLLCSSNSTHRETAEGLLERQARCNNIYGHSDDRIELTVNNDQTWWATSLIEWGVENKLKLVRNGTDHKDSIHQHIDNRLLELGHYITPDERSVLQAFSLNRICDLSLIHISEPTRPY